MFRFLLQVLVPAATDGMSTDGTWNTLGMCATFSPPVTFAGVCVSRHSVLGDPGAAIRVGVVEDFALGYAAVYLGIAEASPAFAADYAKKRIVKREKVAVAQDPAVQRHVGALAAKLDAAQLVLADSASRWDSADMIDRGVLANKAKYLATEAGLEIGSSVIQMVGGRGGYKDHLAERAFRDVRTATLMPPTVDRMLEGIGKSALGLEAGMFNLPGAGQ